MVTKTNGMLKRMSRRMSSAPAVDYADDTSSYLFLSQKAAHAAAATTSSSSAAAAHVEPSKFNQTKNKKPKSKQREQRTGTGKKMQKKLVVLTKGISNSLGDAVSIRKPALAAADKKSRPTSTRSSTSIVRRMTSKMTKLPGRLHHRRSPSATTATADADTTFGTHESSESASGIAIDASLEFAPAITEDDARSLGTSGTTATGATAQVGNLTTNANKNGVGSASSIGLGVLNTILDVSVDISQDGDDGDAEDSCDDDFEEDPIIIAGSRSVNIDYVFEEPQISPNATGRRKHYQGATSGGNSRDGQDKGQGALAKSSIFVNHTCNTSTGASNDQANASSPGVPPPLSLATPVISSSFTPNDIDVPAAAAGYTKGDNLEREQSRPQAERVSVLERFLNRFSCGTGCDSAYSIYEM